MNVGTNDFKVPLERNIYESSKNSFLRKMIKDFLPSKTPNALQNDTFVCMPEINPTW